MHALPLVTRHISLTPALCHGKSLATKHDFLLLAIIFIFTTNVVRPERGLALMAELQLGLLSSKFAAACKVALHYLKFWIYTPTMGDIVINLTTKGNSVWFPAELLQIWQISVRADQYVTCDKLSAFFLLLGTFVHKVVIVSSLEKGLPLPPSCYVFAIPFFGPQIEIRV